MLPQAANRACNSTPFTDEQQRRSVRFNALRDDKGLLDVVAVVAMEQRCLETHNAAESVRNDV